MCVSVPEQTYIFAQNINSLLWNVSKCTGICWGGGAGVHMAYGEKSNVHSYKMLE